ncbi:protein of unknown function [Candidatus Nitrosacidococcus tergens]|uniref:Uncharacterized protein n=1 Tax=Candidatus Nitrosacidococcus tergens TaxID=553981 RepID=A0A7G1Q937_9GAMM|nr:protein of unknown function [Candidatus Nitrosacidococcus tergens]
MIADCGEEGVSAKEACEELSILKSTLSRFRKQLKDESVI